MQAHKSTRRKYLMIFADKLIELRRRNGWSQEDLASRLNVSRQAVAKWEGAQTVPSLDKILQLSEIFEVSTDYLLKDNAPLVTIEEEESSLPTLSLEDANRFLDLNRLNAWRVAIGVVLCILSPAVLIGLSAFTALPSSLISENMVAALGVSVLLVLVAIAVTLFIWSDQIMKPWKTLETGDFSLGYGVKGLAAQKKKAFARTHTLSTIIGIVFCILSPIPPIFSTLFIYQEFSAVLSVTALLLLVSIGVFFLVWSSITQSGFEKILSEGDYSSENRKMEKRMDPVASIYWCLATAIYLGWSFATGNWDQTWIIWPVTGVLFGVVAVIVRLVTQREDTDS